jgi:hypothetical protein
LLKTLAFSSFLLTLFMFSQSPARADDVCATASNLVQNCGFETGNFSDWTVSGDTANAGVDKADAHTGSFGAFFAGLGSFNSGQAHFTILDQLLHTVPGRVYQLAYDTAHFTNTAATPDNVFTAAIHAVTIPGSMQTNVGNLTYHSSGPFVFTAASSLTDLQFSAEDANFFFSLDDVSVVAVPEPSTFAAIFAAGGLLFLFGCARRLWPDGTPAAVPE